MKPNDDFRKLMLRRAAHLNQFARSRISLEIECLGLTDQRLAEHPIAPHLVNAWWHRAAGAPQPGWRQALPCWFEDFLRSAPWLRISKHDDGRLSPRRCRLAMGKQAEGMPDQDLRFLRDQLYVLAEALVDPVAGASA